MDDLIVTIVVIVIIHGMDLHVNQIAEVDLVDEVFQHKVIELQQQHTHKHGMDLHGELHITGI